MKHTELPWHDSGVAFPGTEKEHTYIYGPVPEGKQSGTSIANGVSLADAEFIIRACNNHYELVKALQDIKKHMESTTKMYEYSVTWNIANKALEDIE